MFLPGMYTGGEEQGESLEGEVPLPPQSEPTTALFLALSFPESCDEIHGFVRSSTRHQGNGFGVFWDSPISV